MSKDPAVLFYTSDFLSGTSYMTFEEKGIYITLLCQQHQAGKIPNGHMTALCPNDDHPVKLKFKQDADGFWYNERMEKEYWKRKKYCESRNNNKEGKNQYTKDDGHMTKLCPPYDQAMTGHMDNDNDNINNNIINKQQKTFEELWKRYPRPEGKKAAFKHYCASVKSKEDYDSICKALDNYLEYIEKNVKEKRFIKQGSTFFNNWHDYIEYNG